MGALAAFQPLLNAEPAGDPPLSVLKRGEVICVRSAFNADEDIIVQMRVHPETKHMTFGYTWLVPPDMSMEAALDKAAEWSFHAAFGDVAPWCVNDTLIGAEHGAYEAIRVLAPSHSLTPKDIGSRWTDADGTAFFLVGIPDSEALLFLSENKATAPHWEFVTAVSGGTLKQDGSQRVIPATQTEKAQLFPANRIQSQQFIADGKPLEENIITPCETFEVVDTFSAFLIRLNSGQDRLPGKFRLRPWRNVQIGVGENHAGVLFGTGTA